jgi:hypothetical protein
VLEWTSLLQALSASEEMFVVVELGAGRGVRDVGPSRRTFAGSSGISTTTASIRSAAGSSKRRRLFTSLGWRPGVDVPVRGAVLVHAGSRAPVPIELTDRQQVWVNPRLVRGSGRS